MLKRLNISNFQSHVKTDIVFSPNIPVNLFMGGNGCGKTSILRALRLMTDTMPNRENLCKNSLYDKSKNLQISVELESGIFTFIWFCKTNKCAWIKYTDGKNKSSVYSEPPHELVKELGFLKIEDQVINHLENNNLLFVSTDSKTNFNLINSFLSNKTIEDNIEICQQNIKDISLFTKVNKDRLFYANTKYNQIILEDINTLKYRKDNLIKLESIYKYLKKTNNNQEYIRKLSVKKDFSVQYKLLKSLNDMSLIKTRIQNVPDSKLLTKINSIELIKDKYIKVNTDKLSVLKKLINLQVLSKNTLNTSTLNKIEVLKYLEKEKEKVNLYYTLMLKYSEQEQKIKMVKDKLSNLPIKTCPIHGTVLYTDNGCTPITEE